ncbi:hypothetical protein CMK14_17470 [Candidatus Poribacteria bacterium]|nr:hypothetical protein [Candidatus Poribacteria bacterium]
MAHDAHPRWLGRLEPESEILWEEVENLVQLDSGYLVVDDTTIDKPYGPHNRVGYTLLVRPAPCCS